jgi:hypothetical protein
MPYPTQERYQALIAIALKNLLTTAECDRQCSEIIAMRLKLQYGINLDPAAVCGELEDLIEILQSEDRELLAV